MNDKKMTLGTIETIRKAFTDLKEKSSYSREDLEDLNVCFSRIQGMPYPEVLFY